MAPATLPAAEPEGDGTGIEDVRIRVTPKGVALRKEAERRVATGEAPDLGTALSAAMRDLVMGRIIFVEVPVTERRVVSVHEAAARHGLDTGPSSGSAAEIDWLTRPSFGDEDA